ncbi:uncharacterized protein TNCV_1606051 [Trichonephila clavipes]|nr:uncharacterized protein TNCV_1606051 [Trichonephila clavipes]
MVFLNEVLTEFLDDIPLAAKQRLWFQHEMGLRSISVRNWLDIAYPGRWIGRQGPVLWSPRLPDLTPLNFFPMGPSQGTGVSRRRDNTNGLSCSSACCLYFGGSRGVATYSTNSLSLPQSRYQNPICRIIERDSISRYQILIFPSAFTGRNPLDRGNIPSPIPKENKNIRRRIVPGGRHH